MQRPKVSGSTSSHLLSCVQVKPSILLLISLASTLISPSYPYLSPGLRHLLLASLHQCSTSLPAYTALHSPQVLPLMKMVNILILLPSISRAQPKGVFCHMPEPSLCLIPQHVFLLYCILVMRNYSIRLSQLRAPVTAQTCPLHLESLLLQPGLRSPYPLEASTPPETLPGYARSPNLN